MATVAGFTPIKDPTKISASYLPKPAESAFASGSLLSTKAPTLASVSNASAGTRSVGNNELVQNQINGIIAKNSPLMQQAEARSLQQMNARGLTNSSMAVGAGQSALYDAAMPIANADASTYRSAADQQFGANLDVSKFNAAASNQANQFNIANEMRHGEFNASNANNMSQFNAQNQNQNNQFNVSNAFRANEFNASADNRLSEVNAAAENRVRELNAELGLKDSQFNTEIGSRERLAANELALKDSQFKTELGSKEKLFDKELDSKLELAGIDKETRLELAGIEAKYRSEMQKDQTVGSLFAQANKNISDIQRDDTLTTENKQAAINDQIAMLKSGASVLGGMTDLQLDSLLTFEPSDIGLVAEKKAANTAEKAAEEQAAIDAATEAERARIAYAEANQGGG